MENKTKNYLLDEDENDDSQAPDHKTLGEALKETNPEQLPDTEFESSDVYGMINEQIAFEYHSMLLYHNIAAHMDKIDYVNLAQWFQKKGSEELTHALKFTNFMFERGQDVKLCSIECPEITCTTVLEAFEQSLQHEKKVTTRICKIKDASEQNRVSLGYDFLDWFLNEQIEEEGILMDYISKIKLGATGYLLDLEFQKK